MKLIVGLGNPGEKYQGNRHNIGFLAVDELARGYGFSPWKKRFQGLVAEGQIGLVRAILLKPSTYMNESGRAVGEAIRFYKIAVSDVIVIHDEIDLEPGKIRVKTGGGNAGHNGLKSITAHIGNDYRRVRLGVGHPGDRALVANYVLHDFAKADEEWLVPLLEGVARGMSNLVEGKEASFLSEAARGRKPFPKAAKALGSVESAAQHRAEEPSVEAPLAAAAAVVASSAVFDAPAEAANEGETAFASVDDAIASPGIETPSLEAPAEAEVEAAPVSEAEAREADPVTTGAEAPAVELVPAEAEAPAAETVMAAEVATEPEAEATASEPVAAETQAEAPASEIVAIEEVSETAADPEALAAIVAVATKPIEPMPLPSITVSVGRDGSGGAVSSAVMLPHPEAGGASEAASVFDLERDVPPQRVPRDQEILATREALGEATAPKQPEPDAAPVATSGEDDAIVEAAETAPVPGETYDASLAGPETVVANAEAVSVEAATVEEAVAVAEAPELATEPEIVSAAYIEPEADAEPIQAGTPDPEPAPAPTPEPIIDPVPAPEPQPVPEPEPVGDPDPAPEPAPVPHPDPVQEPEPSPLPEQVQAPVVAEPARELEFAAAASATLIDRPSAAEHQAAPLAESETAAVPVAKKKGGGFFGWFRRRPRGS
ncbi:aminoacyl-tRNA hydrolase [Rhodomicrobium sp. Az07]|uniref:aminoacyl-tRNA hydrolase n=1 Tax=Rhodomicrobium sp. Az07 TaxID=2839034 RepID=UPI001BE71524|nr:aminoacyl-tRNA hydrolase [Rhodomicrobium sp. Az07]